MARKPLDHPRLREERERVRQVAERVVAHPIWQQEQEKLRRIKEREALNGRPSPEPGTRRRRQRGPGGGRKPKLIDAQIAKSQKRYEQLVERDPTLRKRKGAAAFLLWPSLPRSARHLNPRTVIRLVINPVLARTK
jgi:hypothetical protein